MGLEVLSSRAVVGRYYATLEQNTGASWVPKVSNSFSSNQGSEEYPWLGQVPQLREWVGGRQPKGLRATSIRIDNKDWEATLEILIKDMRRDKTGQIFTRVDELAERTLSHDAKLITAALEGGEASLAYDGQYFFDTDHSYGDSGTQTNLHTYNVTTPNAPTAAEMEAAIMQSVQKLLAIKDDQGEPFNDGAKSFLIMVPVNLFGAAAAALKNPVIVDGSGSRTNLITNLDGFTFELAVNSRLTEDDSFYTFRTDAVVKPVIVQLEEPVKLEAIAEGSELAFNDKKFRFGVSKIGNVGLGLWERCCKTTLT